MVLIPDPAMRAVVMAGLARAGEHPQVSVIDLQAGNDGSAAPAGADPPEAVLIMAPAGDPNAIMAPALDVESLGCRLLLTIAVHLSSGLDHATVALLADAQLPETTVAVPSIDDDEARRELWDALGAAAGGRHHLVDVDGSPALAELADVGPVVAGDLRWLQGAGAAGVLAGRMVVGNRRWRPPVEG